MSRGPYKGYHLIAQLPPAPDGSERWSARTSDGDSAEVILGGEALWEWVQHLPADEPWVGVSSGTEDGQTWALIPDPHARNFLQLRPAPAPVAVAAVRELLIALHKLHRRSRFHGQLHPAGVGFDIEGRLRVRPLYHEEALPDPDGQPPGPPTDCWQAGALLLYLLGGTWPPSRRDVAVPDTGGLNAVRLKLLIDGLMRDQRRWRLSPARRAYQAASAVIRDVPDIEDLLTRAARGEIERVVLPAPAPEPYDDDDDEERAPSARLSLYSDDDDSFTPAPLEPVPVEAAPVEVEDALSPLASLEAEEEDIPTDERPEAQLSLPSLEAEEEDLPTSDDEEDAEDDGAALLAEVTSMRIHATAIPREIAEKLAATRSLLRVDASIIPPSIAESLLAEEPVLQLHLGSDEDEDEEHNEAAPPPADPDSARLALPVSHDTVQPSPADVPSPITPAEPDEDSEEPGHSILERDASEMAEALWGGGPRITEGSEREAELGAGKWAEEGRSLDELTREMPSTPTREIEIEEPKSWGLIVAAVLLSVLALVAALVL